MKALPSCQNVQYVSSLYQQLEAATRKNGVGREQQSQQTREEASLQNGGSGGAVTNGTANTNGYSNNSGPKQQQAALQQLMHLQQIHQQLEQHQAAAALQQQGLAAAALALAHGRHPNHPAGGGK